MLTDWEHHRVPKGMLADLSPRHAPEVKFRPRSIDVRRDPRNQVVIVKISGGRVHGAAVDNSVLDDWEWDVTRDVGTMPVCVARVLKLVG